MARTRVMCVDDSEDIGEMLRRLVLRTDDLEFVGSLVSTGGLAGEVERRRPDVLVMDLSMPGECPLEAIREIAACRPGCRVIAYSGTDDAALLNAAMDAGAREHRSKAAEPAGIIECIRRVARSR